MTDIKGLLDSCPLMDGYKVDELVDMMPGVFCQGVIKTRADILGNVRTIKRYVLKKRCVRGDSWGQEMAAWALSRGLAVSGGRLTGPATDATGIYELTVDA